MWEGSYLDVQVLPLPNSFSEVLIAAEDGILGVAHTPRGHRPGQMQTAMSATPPAGSGYTERAPCAIPAAALCHAQIPMAACALTPFSKRLWCWTGADAKNQSVAQLARHFHAVRLLSEQEWGGASREEGAPAEHARLQEAPRGPQKQLHVVAPGKLGQPRVQLCRHHHCPGQVRVHLHDIPLPLSGHGSDTLDNRPETKGHSAGLQHEMGCLLPAQTGASPVN